MKPKSGAKMGKKRVLNDILRKHQNEKRHQSKNLWIKFYFFFINTLISCP